MPTDFESYYTKLIERAGPYNHIHDFFERLRTPTMPVLRYFANDEDGLRALWTKHYEWRTLSWYPQALVWPNGVPMGDTLPGFEQGLIYPMNASSLVPVIAMNLGEHDLVLDACAAPGGKALMIAEKVFAGEGHLVANDISMDRYIRLEEVFANTPYAKYVELSRLPAETIFKDTSEVFDKVLVDAPCSSEKHIYTDNDRLERWTTRRITKLRRRQYVMIERLLRTLRPGGRLVYATCAITPEENELVVGKLLKNRADQLRLVEVDWGELPGGPGIEGKYDADFDVRWVRRIWPDKHYDPMFVAVFEKL